MFSKQYNWKPTPRIQVKLKSENIVLGSICIECSLSNMDKVIETYQKLIKQKISENKKTVEINLFRPALKKMNVEDFGEIMVTVLVFDFEDSLYDPNFIAIIPRKIKDKGEVPGAFSFFKTNLSMQEDPFYKQEKHGQMDVEGVGIMQGMIKDNKIRKLQVQELERTFRRVLEEALEQKKKVKITRYTPAIFQTTSCAPQTFLTIASE